MTTVILHPDPSACRALEIELPGLAARHALLKHDLPQVLIRWGSEQDSDLDAQVSVVLNKAGALQNVPQAHDVWAKGSVPVGYARSMWYRRYRYYLFDLQPVRVLRREIGQGTTLEVSAQGSKEARDGAALATRALHALRLDFGAVEAGVDSKGSLKVLGVDPAPKVTERLAKAYAEQIRQRIREAELRQTLPIFQKANPHYLDKVVSVGADPEFMLRDCRTRRLVMASRFFPREGTVGCDARFVRGAVSGYPLAEIRPAPSYSPLQLVENIRMVMRKALRLAPYANIEWRAGSMPFEQFPVGGHIHFKGVQLSGQLLRALDNYLAVPLLLIEEPTSARRRREKYGYLGDFRLKPHGGFEYRTPASWLVSPEVSRAALCLAKVIASEYHVLTRDVFLRPEAQQAFARADRGYFLPHFTALWSDLAVTETFGLYEHGLKVLEKMILSHETWVEKVDIRKTWGLQIPRARIYRG